MIEWNWKACNISRQKKTEISMKYDIFYVKLCLPSPVNWVNRMKILLNEILMTLRQFWLSQRYNKGRLCVFLYFSCILLWFIVVFAFFCIFPKFWGWLLCCFRQLKTTEGEMVFLWIMSLQLTVSMNAASCARRLSQWIQLIYQFGAKRVKVAMSYVVFE